MQKSLTETTELQKGTCTTSSWPPPARLITGIIHASCIPIEQILNELQKAYSGVEMMSITRPFSWTSYYNREMGNDLDRTFLAFGCLVPQDSLVEMKKKAIALEEKWKKKRKTQCKYRPGHPHC